MVRVLTVLVVGAFLPLFAWMMAEEKRELPPVASAPVDFVRDIAPILRGRCIECHGAAQQKAGLRLDAGARALQGGDSGKVILPGKSAESRLIHLVAGIDAKIKMPPKGPALTASEVGKLRAWIDRGAAWPKDLVLSAPSSHWSFQPIRRPTPPKVTGERWVKNDIDRFILARLEAEKIAPAAQADKATLIRRLSLDLTGLPPTPREVEDFLADDAADAYERLVDRLLDSPAFGEHWARHWLDLARYADSDGYEKDLARPHAWRWRDWVIDAFNRDLPFDRFTIEQMAGDLLPPPTPPSKGGGFANIEQRVATGFHRNTLLNREGGIDIEEDRNKVAVDRINTVASVWLGLTVGCAECHSHKYDPISQREYYQLFAFFNSTDDRDIVAPPPGAAGELDKRRQAFAAAQRTYLKEAGADFETWTKKLAALPDIWKLPDAYELPTFHATNGANLFPQEDGSFLVSGTVGSDTHYVVMCNTRMRGISGIRVEALADDMLPGHGPGWNPRGNFILSELRVDASPLADVTRLRTHAIEKAVADYSQPDFDIANAIDGDDKTGWSVDLPGLRRHGLDRCAVFALKEKIGHEGSTRLKIALVQHGGIGMSLGRFRVMLTMADAAALADQAVPARIRASAMLPAERRSLDQQCELLRYYHATFKPEHQALKEYTEDLHEWVRAQGDVKAQVLVERALSRPTHVHIRGDFLRKGAVVTPGFLGVLPHPTQSAGLHRLDLARWLVDPGNPLTARVTVNRLWHHLFGQGLLRTLADFGTQGDRPSHPELLDWLASEFVNPQQGSRAKPWSQKAILKTIVMSATYRQSSKGRPELLERDAQNRLLARQNRFRLPAEAVRDQCLAASGLLKGEVGGASLPVASKRRGLYVHCKRTQPEYMFATFDAPSGTVSCPMRERSNTPLQALVLLNDPLFVECAQALTRRTLREADADLESRIGHAFRLCLGRVPDAVELKALRELFAGVEKIYRDDEEGAGKVAGKDMPLDVGRSEAAALVVVARAILNLDELITRE